MKKSVKRVKDPRPAVCRACPSLCCRYISVDIIPPRTREEFDTVRWFLLHRGVTVHVETDGAWWVRIANVCRKLGPDNLCRDYANRPSACRQYDRRHCEFVLGPRRYVTEFADAAQFEKYARAQLNRRRRGRE